MPEDQPAREVTHRKPPLESRWTRNRRLMQGPGGPPPPTADYEVIGNGDPSPNGDYFENGVHNEHPVYVHENNGFAIWYWIGGWHISAAPGSTAHPWWERPAPDEITGEYVSNPPATGNPVVQTP